MLFQSPKQKRTSKPSSRRVSDVPESVWRVLLNLIITTFAAFLIAFGVNEFLVPAQLLTSGLAGVCIIFFKIFHWPISLQFFVFNIPLLILGYRSVGKNFMFYTIIAVMEQSVFLAMLRIPHSVTDDPILSAVFGGFIVGLGSGLCLRVGGSAGGFDILARLFARHQIPVGTSLLVINGAIILVSSALFDIELALYTLVSIFIASKTYDLVLSNMDRVTFLIVSSRPKEIEQGLLRSAGVEATTWSNTAERTETPKQTLFCVAVKSQVPVIREFIKEADPDAICSILPTQDVIGGSVRGW